MKEKISTFFQTIRDFWGNASKKLRIILVASLAFIVLLSVVAAALLNRKEYVLLYNTLTNAESAQVLTVLQEMGVETKVGSNGSISVPERDENRVRMRLATEGLPATSFGYDTFKEGSSLTATQAEKARWELNQTQDRLAAMIMTMDEVQQAVVNISVPKGTLFALQNNNEEATAAVMLVKVPGKELSLQQLRGIVNLVKHSVVGLKEENITIADETGELSVEDVQSQRGNDEKLELTEKVNASIQKRALSVLQPIFGEGKVEVAANCVLDTNDQVTERTTYLPVDPENPANNPLDYAEFTRDKDGEGFAGAAGVPGANDNVGTPQYAAMEEEANNATYYSGHDVYDYLVGSEKDQIVKNGLVLTDATVAVIIDAAALPDGQRDQVFDTVSRATGIPVEKISVQNYQFNLPDSVPETIGEQLDVRRVVLITGLIVIALLILSIIATIIIGRRRQRKALEQGQDEEIDFAFGPEYAQDEDDYAYDDDFSQYIDEDEEEDEEEENEDEEDEEDEEQDEDEEEQEENEPTLVELLQQGEFGPIALGETQEQKLKAQIKDLADTDPEIVAQLLKTWLMSK